MQRSGRRWKGTEESTLSKRRMPPVEVEREAEAPAQTSVMATLESRETSKQLEKEEEEERGRGERKDEKAEIRVGAGVRAVTSTSAFDGIEGVEISRIATVHIALLLETKKVLGGGA